jgi:L-aspartate oxidase
VTASSPIEAQAPLRRLPAASPSWETHADIVVVGAGAAGLSAARVAAAAGRDVLVLAKGDRTSSSTHAAQGGLAAVLDADDRLALHASDTVDAGAGLCDPAAVAALVGAAPAEVAALQGIGASFDADDGLPAIGRPPALGREGGHSRRRIVHAHDASGAEVSRALTEALPSTVRLMQPAVLVDVLLGSDGRAAGVLAGRVDADGRVEPGVICARAVVIATGGFGHAWATTSNPEGLTGDGLAAAVRAGAVVQDVEFVQFHPTVLYSGPGASGRQPLITEALRGEGATLVDATGARVMTGGHPLGDLAPRDVVAAAMLERMREAPGGVDTHLLLDATALGEDLLTRRFKNLVAACRAAGIDPAREPIPVAPGAHYTCGGVAADLSGRTSVRGLYAVGEVACTGVHGANRLASNSVTEALASGRRCGSLLAARLEAVGPAQQLQSGRGAAAEGRRRATLAMSRDVAMTRTADGLDRTLSRLRAAPEISDRRDGALSAADVESTSLHTVSTLVALAARVREESRGCHRRADFPARSERWRRRLSMQAGDDAIALRIGPEVGRWAG